MTWMFQKLFLKIFRRHTERTIWMMWIGQKKHHFSDANTAAHLNSSQAMIKNRLSNGTDCARKALPINGSPFIHIASVVVEFFFSHLLRQTLELDDSQALPQTTMRMYSVLPCVMCVLGAENYVPKRWDGRKMLLFMSNSFYFFFLLSLPLSLSRYIYRHSFVRSFVHSVIAALNACLAPVDLSHCKQFGYNV